MNLKNIISIFLLLMLINAMLYAQELDLEMLIAGIKHYDSLIESYAGKVVWSKVKSDMKSSGLISEDKVKAFVAGAGQNQFYHTLENKTTKGWIAICLGPGLQINIIPDEKGQKRYFKHDKCLPIDQFYCDPVKWYTNPWGYARYRELPFWEQIEKWNLRIIKKEEIPIWDGHSDNIICWSGQKLKRNSIKKKDVKKVMCYVIGKGSRRDKFFQHAWVAPDMGFRILKSESRASYGGDYCGHIRLIHYKRYRYQEKTIFFPDRALWEVAYLDDKNENKFVGYNGKVIIDMKEFKVNIDVSKYFNLRNWIPTDAEIIDANSKQPILAKEIFKWAGEKP